MPELAPVMRIVEGSSLLLMMVVGLCFGKCVRCSVRVVRMKNLLDLLRYEEMESRISKNKSLKNSLIFPPQS